MMIIDAEKMVLGRLAAFVAKKALLGEKVNIINCEKAVVTGNRADVLAKYKRKVDMGIPLRGPYFRRKPEQIVKRAIRGMLPYKQEKGNTAFKNIMCYEGVPEEFEGKDTVDVPGASVSKVLKIKHYTINEISKELGAKV